MWNNGLLGYIQMSRAIILPTLWRSGKFHGLGVRTYGAYGLGLRICCLGLGVGDLLGLGLRFLVFGTFDLLAGTDCGA